MQVVHTIRRFENQYGGCFLLEGLLMASYRDCVLGGSLSFRLYAHSPASSSERASTQSVDRIGPSSYVLVVVLPRTYRVTRLGFISNGCVWLVHASCDDKGTFSLRWLPIE